MSVQNPALVQSLRELAEDFGLELLSLPMKIYDSDEADGAPAFIDARGICVSQGVVDHDAANLKVYLAHEILHPVVECPEETGGFDPELVNVATDYKINQILQEVWGYDVRRVYYPGLRSRQYDKLSVPQICASLAAAGGIKADAPHIQYTMHPLVLRQAGILKQRLAKYLGRSALVEYFFLDRVDSDEFYRESEKVSDVFVTQNIKRINLLRVLRGIWCHCYLDRSATPFEGHTFSTGETLTYVFPGMRARQVTKGNAALSLVCAYRFIRRVDEDPEYQRLEQERAAWRIEVAKRRVSSIKRTLRTAKGQATIRALQARLERARKLVKKRRREAESIAYRVSLPALLARIKTEAKPITKTAPRVASLRNFDLKVKRVSDYEKEMSVPRFRPNEVTRRLKALGYSIIEQAQRVVEIKQGLEKRYGDLSQEKPSTEKPDAPDNDPLPSTGERASKNKKKRQSAETGSPRDEVGEDPELSSTGGSGPGQDGSGSDGGMAARKAKAKDSDAESSGDHAAEEEDCEDGGMPSRTSAAGKGRGKGRTFSFSVEDFLFANAQWLTMLLTLITEFETRLKRSKTSGKIGASGVDSVFTYSNDIPHVVASEIGLLANEDTKFEFFAKLANHSLLSVMPPENKRYPVILCLDCSGSMGSIYDVAVAYVLAMVNLLHKDKRGVGLILFDSNVERQLVFDTDKPINIVDILRVILAPSFGGTDFDNPLLAALDIKAQLGWPSVCVQLITDGQATVRRDTEIAAKKGPTDRIDVVLVTGRARLSSPVIDSIVVATKLDALTFELETLGKSVF